MEPLDNNIDDLLRKAAADYPLNTGEDDWDKVLAKLVQVPAGSGDIKKRSFKYFFLVVFTLLLFLLLGGLFYDNNGGKELRGKAKKVRAKDAEPAPATYKKRFKKEIVTPPNEIKVLQEIDGLQKTSIQGSLKRFRSEAKHQQAISGNIVPAETVDSLPEKGSNDLTSSDVNRRPATLHYSIPEPPLSLTGIMVSSKRFSSKNGLYLGLNGGPELSKVSSQSIAKTGFHAGLLVGFRFNSKLSIETGIMPGKKKYYSMGKYFSMRKIGSSMPAGMEIVTITGQHTHLEIPVVLKYDIHRRPTSGLFFSTGLVSYLYLREINHYETLLNGVKDNQKGMYKADYFSLFSELQISGGYEHAIGRSSTFRIEPYKKIPVKKTGMGSMSVFSSGVNITLIHSFGK